MNPHSNSEARGWMNNEIIGLEGGQVLTAPSHSEADDVGHHVEVRPDLFDQPVIADVRVDQIGDVAIPAEGERVVLGYRANGRPLVLGARYSTSDNLPEFEPGERIVGHPLSDAHIKLASDGTVHIQGDTDVVVNDGSTRPVTDVETATDADGYITDVSLSRANSLFVPSE